MYGCQKNPADCVMVMLEFCNDEKVIFAVLYLQPLGHPYSVVINWTVFYINVYICDVLVIAAAIESAQESNGERYDVCHGVWSPAAPFGSLISGDE